MRLHYELANFLIASWRLARAGEKLPTSHGVLDRALERAQERLPDRFRGALTFVDTPIGRLCSELPRHSARCAGKLSNVRTQPNIPHGRD